MYGVCCAVLDQQTVLHRQLRRSTDPQPSTSERCDSLAMNDMQLEGGGLGPLGQPPTCGEACPAQVWSPCSVLTSSSQPPRYVMNAAASMAWLVSRVQPAAQLLPPSPPSAPARRSACPAATAPPSAWSWCFSSSTLSVSASPVTFPKVALSFLTSPSTVRRSSVHCTSRSRALVQLARWRRPAAAAAVCTCSNTAE